MEIQIKVYKESKNKYCATIKDGWWMAIGRTKKEAINRVVERYLKEIQY